MKKKSIIAPLVDQITPKRGIGKPVLCLIFSFLAWIAFCMLFKRVGQPKLSDVARLRLSGRLHLGSALGWGIFFLIMGGGLIAAYFSIEKPESSDHAMFWIVALPTALSALFLMMLPSVHNHLQPKIDLLLQYAWLNRKIEHGVSLGQKKNSPNKYEVENLMAELERHKVVQFHLDGNGDYLIDALHPMVEHHFAQHPVDSAQIDCPQWVCKGCGATNSTVCCAYCGNNQPS